MHKTKIKICGLFRDDDIDAVNLSKPDFAGFIVNYPKSHRSVDVETLLRLTSRLDRKSIKAVGVFVNEKVETVAGLLNNGTIDCAQLHGQEDEKYISELKSLTQKPIIKAFVLKTLQNGNDKSIDEMLKNAEETVADYVLFDGGMGSGSSFDHSTLKAFKRKFFLAGGLDENNSLTAISELCPFAIDLSSAVETNRLKDPEKIRRITELIKSWQ